MDDSTFGEQDSPWGNNPAATTDAEWTKISFEFTNAGYREGISAGKEAALQEGFDDGFARIGVPLGRDIGFLRGLSNALLASATAPASISQGPDSSAIIAEARDIAASLGKIRLTDIAPRDFEAEEHARQHLEADDAMETNDELDEKRKLENVEDMLSKLTAGSSSVAAYTNRPTVQDVTKLRERIKALCTKLALDVEWS